MRRIDALVFCCAAACLFAVVSCSSVFTSTITGTVQELDGTQTKDVSDVDVYAFLTESERNEAVSNGTKPETTVRIFHAIGQDAENQAPGDIHRPIDAEVHPADADKQDDDGAGDGGIHRCRGGSCILWLWRRTCFPYPE